MRQQSRPPATYRNPYSGLCQARAMAVDEALSEIERELARHMIGFGAVERAALTFVLERFAERWPKERGWP